MAALDFLPRWLRRGAGRPVPVANPYDEGDERLRPFGVKAISAADLLGTFTPESLTSYEDILRQVSTNVWASWKACDVTAAAVAETPFQLVRGTASRVVKMPELEALLANPNETMTWWELVYLTALWLKFVGNAYWIKEEARTADGGRPRSLMPVSPARCWPSIDSATGKLLGYVVRGPNGIRVPFDPEEVIHFKRPSPVDPYIGIGEVEAGRVPIMNAINGAKAAENAAKNGNIPPSVLVLEENFPTDKETWKKLKEDWSRDYGGPKNAGKVAWLGGKWKNLTLGLSPKELNELETRRLTIEEIFHLHGVPLSVAGVRDAANYATAEIDMTRFRSMAVAPLVRLIEEAVNSDLVVTYAPDLRLRFTVMGLINVGGVLTSILPAFDRGVVSINEVRKMIGLEPITNPIFDDHYFAGQYTPVDLAGLAPADPALMAQATEREDGNAPQPGL